MGNIDWSDQKPKKKPPTKKQIVLYNRWRKYLKYSKLTLDEQHDRAASYAERRKIPPE